MKIVIIGTGYVGLVTGTCLADLGHDVICIDKDKKKITSVNNCQSPIFEDGLDDMLERVVSSGKLRASSNLTQSINNADVTMIAVGTPFDGKIIDLSFIKEATMEIAEALDFAPDYHVVCVKSTVVPGTTKNVIGPILEKYSNRKIGHDLGLTMNPEFLAEGTAIKDFQCPDRIVIGSNDNKAAKKIKELYQSYEGTEIFFTGLSTAEMIKYTANSFLASVISFTNELANLCSKVEEIDAVEVMRGVHADRRLSPLINGKRITPGLMSFLHPGTGFGGSCFPKDVNALISFGENLGNPMPILNAVMETNDHQPSVTLDIIKDELGTLADKHIAILGLAFKPGTDDVRESPSLKIIKNIIDQGGSVFAHDPIAIESMKKYFNHPNLYYCLNLNETIKNVDAIVLATSWPEYESLDKILDNKMVPVIDGRRVLNKSDFNCYHGIGLNGVVQRS